VKEKHIENLTTLQEDKKRSCKQIMSELKYAEHEERREEARETSKDAFPRLLVSFEERHEFLKQNVSTAEVFGAMD
jgi:hypothetical protein